MRFQIIDVYANTLCVCVATLQLTKTTKRVCNKRTAGKSKAPASEPVRKRRKVAKKHLCDTSMSLSLPIVRTKGSSRQQNRIRDVQNKEQARPTLQPTGTWCSGITPAQHAGGPGFNPQCVHLILSGSLLLLIFAFLLTYHLVHVQGDVLRKSGLPESNQ